MLDWRSFKLQQNDQICQDGVVKTKEGGVVEVEHVQGPDWGGAGEAVDEQIQFPPLLVLDSVSQLESPEGFLVMIKALAETLSKPQIWKIL